MQHFIICVNIHAVKTGTIEIFSTTYVGTTVIDSTTIGRQQVNALTIATVELSRQQLRDVQVFAARTTLLTGKHLAAKNRYLIHIERTLYLSGSNYINRHKPFIRTFVNIPSTSRQSHTSQNSQSKPCTNFCRRNRCKRNNRLRFCKIIYNFRWNILLHAARLLNNIKFFHCNSRMTSMMSFSNTARSTS